jgi:hypothetical protein
LPDPVGAEMSVCSPVAIAGHACACTSVGASNADSNQVLTAGANCDSGTPPGYLRADAISLVRSSTPSIISAVSLPVKVFCWLG